MNRRLLLSTLAGSVAACALARPALAAGLITFHNGSGSPILVEVRIGDTLESSSLYGSQPVSKSGDWVVDTSGVLAWWRREITPGANDGKFSDWKRVNTLSSDEKVNL